MHRMNEGAPLPFRLDRPEVPQSPPNLADNGVEGLLADGPG